MQKRAVNRRLTALVLALALPGCTVGPNFVPPKPVVTRAGFWPRAGSQEVRPSATEPQPIDTNWWIVFGDPELTRLEARLATDNLDLATYLARLSESRAQLGVTGAEALPTLQADGSYTRERTSEKGVLSLFGGSGGGGSFASQGSSANGTSGRQGGIPTSSTGSTLQPFDLFQYGFDASWEIDIWGHVRREVEAARASVQAAQEEARDTLVSAEAELARDYVELRSTQQQIKITEADLKSFKTTLKLTSERSAAGLSGALDVSTARGEVASAQATLPSLLAQQVQLLNAICLLLGQPPGALDAELATPEAIPPVPPVVPVGLPSELVRRRPDIRAAEAQLRAATADVGVAVADFFPQISLTGSFGLQALQIKTLGSWAARQYGFGPTISLPIFEGGKLRATLRLRKAQEREAAITYRRTVLAAFGDVSNALTSYDQEQTRRVALQEATAADQRSLMLATQRYREGIDSFINVLDAERSLLQSEQQLTTSTATVSTDLVALYKSLGGGWQT
jgi:NodT family efflux transporter outer membrane factor (OMF) lipoprotein